MLQVRVVRCWNILWGCGHWSLQFRIGADSSLKQKLANCVVSEFWTVSRWCLPSCKIFSAFLQTYKKLSSRWQISFLLLYNQSLAISKRKVQSAFISVQCYTFDCSVITIFMILFSSYPDFQVQASARHAAQHFHYRHYSSDFPFSSGWEAKSTSSCVIVFSSISL